MAVGKRAGVRVLAAAVAAGGVAMLVALACPSQEEVRAPAGEAAPSASQGPSASAAPPAGAAAGEAFRPMPPQGRFVVEVDGDRVTVLANRADRIDVLRSLAQKLGFELELHAVRFRSLSTRIENEPVPAVLQGVLQGVGFATDYEVDDAGRHVLAWVAVGEPVESEPPGVSASAREAVASAEREAAGAAPDAPGAGSRGTRGEGRAESLIQRVLAAREAYGRSSEEREQDLLEAEEEQAALEEQLADADPVVRAQALEDFDVDGESVHQLVDIARNDPSDEVRLEAVRMLGNETSIAAANGVRAALQDPSVPVVLAALEEVEFLDDSVRVDVEPLLDHPDPAVRAAADEVLDGL